MVSNVHRHLDKHSILANKQHGFRAKRSCESQLISFTQELFQNVVGGGQVYAVVLDFSKAFDKVNAKVELWYSQYYIQLGHSFLEY